MVRAASILLLLTVAACGGDDDGGGGGDADAGAGADAQPDPDGGPTATTVRFSIDDAVTPEGVLIFSSDGDGAVHDQAETDEDGEATLEVVTGGSVTIAYQDELSSSWSLYTMRGVEPGDVLLWGSDHAPDAGTMVDVTMPVKAGTDSYKVAHPCGSTSGPSNDLFLTHHDWCDRDPYTILGVTEEDELATGYQFLDGVDLATDPVELDATWAAVGTYGITVTDVPVGVASLEVGELARRNGTANEFNRSTVPDETDEAFTMQHLPNFGQQHEVYGTLNYADAGRYLRELDVTLTGADVEIDAGDFLPLLEGDVTYDEDSRALTFPDPGDDWDLTLLEIFYVSDDMNVTWHVHGPGGSNTEVLPELPEAIEGLMPADDLTVYTQLDEITLDMSWDDIRALPEIERVNIYIHQADGPWTWRRTYMSDVTPL